MADDGKQNDGGDKRRRSLQAFFENKAIRRREGALERRVHAALQNDFGEKFGRLGACGQNNSMLQIVDGL
jgi:hypothetical protein